MKRILVLCLFATSVLLFATIANADILFYGGDFDPNNGNANGLANETDGIVGGSPYGAATFQNFIIPQGQTWDIESLFTNNLTNFVGPRSAYYEIRSGMSDGNGGTLLKSGTATLGVDFTWTATGRSGFGLPEFQAHVTFDSFDLGPGMYWFAVVPNDDGNGTRSFNSNTFGLNKVGNSTLDLEFFDSGFFGAVYANADGFGVFPTFSSGVDGQILGGVPEPGTLIMLGTGVLGLAGAIRRKLF